MAELNLEKLVDQYIDDELLTYSYILVSMQLCLSAIYNYAVDIVSLWCQIARASVMVTCFWIQILYRTDIHLANKSSINLHNAYII